MSRFASFAAGLLSGGMKEYVRQDGVKRQDERDARERDNHAWNMEQRQRERDQIANVEMATKDYTELLKSGEVMEMPKMSSEMGPPPEAAPDGAGMALQMPTARKATLADRLGAEMKIAQANRDMTSFARLGRERQQAVDAEGDLNFARAVMENPTGDDAKKLMRTIYKKTDAFSMRQDPKTGLATVDVFSPSGDFERSVELSPAQLGQAAVAWRKFNRGEISSLNDIAGIDKGLAANLLAEMKVKQMQAQIEQTKANTRKADASIADSSRRTELLANKDKRESEEAMVKREEGTRKIADALAKQSAAVGFARERNPDASAAHLEAVRTGVIQAAPKEGAWKFESGDINSMLGTPATSPSGRPILDANGRQVFNTDPARVQQLMQFMQQRGIRDTNEALPQFIVWEAERKRTGAGATAQRRSLATPKVGEIFDGFAFKGGDPRDRRNWQPAAAGKVQ